jgi:hypothetical protein
MSAYAEVHKLIEQEYTSLRERNPQQLDGRKLWKLAEKYVRASLQADWLIAQSNYKVGAFNEK